LFDESFEAARVFQLDEHRRGASAIASKRENVADDLAAIDGESDLVGHEHEFDGVVGGSRSGFD
jgi:hypothetical protein